MKKIKTVIFSVFFIAISLTGFSQQKSYFNPDQIDIPYTQICA